MIFTPSVVVDVLLLMIPGIMVGHGLTLKLRRRFVEHAVRRCRDMEEGHRVMHT